MKPDKISKKGKVAKKKGNSTLIVGALAVLILAGIAYAVFSPANDSTSKKTESEIKLPSYAYTSPVTLKAYRYATEHPDLLEQIPCYCGCGGHSGHRFLRDCYIHDDWTYDEHASFCDVCVGEAIKVQEYLAAGKTLKEARALIDDEYSKKGGDRTNTPAVSDYYKPLLTAKLAAAPAQTGAVQTQSVDLSGLFLPDNFKSLSDGLKLVPPGIAWAYFANLKQGTGMEQKEMPDLNFYGIPVVGMLNSEYPDKSFVELHDVGKANANVRSNAGNDADNILYTRPYIFATKDKTNSVLALFKEPGSTSAYNSIKDLLDKVDDENAGFARVTTQAPSFADVTYFGIVKSGTDIKGEIAFRVKDNGAIPLTRYNELKNSSAGRGFRSYEVRKENNTLIISMTSNLNNVISEATQNYGISI